MNFYFTYDSGTRNSSLSMHYTAAFVFWILFVRICICFCFEMDSYAAQTEPSTQPKTTLKFSSSCLHFPSTQIIACAGMPNYTVLGIELRD